MIAALVVSILVCLCGGVAMLLAQDIPTAICGFVMMAAGLFSFFYIANVVQKAGRWRG